MPKPKKYGLYSLLPYKDFFLHFFQPRRAYLYYKKKRIDLLLGNEETIEISDLINRCASVELEDHIIFHAFYELGFFFTHGFEELKEDRPLALWIEYDEVRTLKSLGGRSEVKLSEWKGPSFEQYQHDFNIGKEHLVRGDCYQYNLTYPFTLETSHSGLDLARHLWRDQKNRGRYGSFTSVEYLQRSYLSNSPECLFFEDEQNLFSLPIKGTVALKREKDLAKQKRNLGKSVKNESELFMITDLVANDMNWLSNFKAEVVSRKSFLKAPGILHSYSIIRAPLHEKTSLKSILKALFPGGSITGAPKKRVVEILESIEQGPRGFYCGSTIVKSGKLFGASINIRSCTVLEDQGQVRYHAGGGITFDSDCRDEYEEMFLKVESFTQPLLG